MVYANGEITTGSASHLDTTTTVVPSTPSKSKLQLNGDIPHPPKTLVKSPQQKVKKKEIEQEERDERIRGAVATILECIDPQPKRHGLLRTPDRVAKSIQFLTSGYSQHIDSVINEALFSTDDDKVGSGSHSMMNGFASSVEGEGEELEKGGSGTNVKEYVAPIIIKGIDLFSLCEHHMLPFCGKAIVAYKPQKGKVIGLSKIARIIDIFARRLQLQERLTQQVCTTVERATGAHGVAVVVEAWHMCMVSRGVQKANAQTKTMAFAGDYSSNQEERREVLSQMT